MKGLGDFLELKYIAKESDSGRTVKSILKNELKLSERMVKRLKRDERIYINSQSVHVANCVKTGDIVSVDMNFNESCDEIIPEKIEIDILYEDEYLMVLNKQPNMVVHPTARHQTGTVANAIIYYLNQKGMNIKIRPVSRLDKDTTGVIIFAKNAHIQNALAVQMSNKTFLKEYIGLVWGTVDKCKGTIDLPIERKPDSIMLRHVTETGKPSVTHYEVLKSFEYATLLKFSLETGRTHQIRVHCQAINHPIIGDTLYWKWIPDMDVVMQKYNLQYNYSIINTDYYVSNSYSDDKIFENTNNYLETNSHLYDKYKYINSIFIQRQALHSYKTSFVHPVTNKYLEIYAPLHADMKKALEILENK